MAAYLLSTTNSDFAVQSFSMKLRGGQSVAFEAVRTDDLGTSATESLKTETFFFCMKTKTTSKHLHIFGNLLY